MAWFRPARNRKHPGDPPPKWAPLGRAGRLVLAATVIAGVVIALMIMATRTAGAADGTSGSITAPEPSPLPWFGGRAEMPEFGFVVTVPDGGFAFDLTGDLYAQALSVMASLNPGASENDLEDTTRAWSDLLRQRMQGQLMVGSSQSACGIAVGPALDEDLDSVAARFYDRQSSDESVTHVGPPNLVDLAAGPAHLLTYGRTGEEVAVYIGKAADSAFDIFCYGPERPEDDWLSIAETFEFLEESSETTPPYAPDDLASLLPESLNGLPLASVAGRGDELVADGLEDLGGLQDVLAPLGSGLTDFHKATAMTGDPRSPNDVERALAPEGYAISAIRVDGVPGEVLWDRMMRVIGDIDDDEPLPAPFRPPRTLLGRTYLWTNNADGAPGERWAVQYAKGEVLFMVSGWGGLTAPEVLGELP